VCVGYDVDRGVVVGPSQHIAGYRVSVYDATLSSMSKVDLVTSNCSIIAENQPFTVTFMCKVLGDGRR